MLLLFNTDFATKQTILIKYSASLKTKLAVI